MTVWKNFWKIGWLVKRNKDGRVPDSWNPLSSYLLKVPFSCTWKTCSFSFKEIKDLVDLNMHKIEQGRFKHGEMWNWILAKGYLP